MQIPLFLWYYKQGKKSTKGDNVHTHVFTRAHGLANHDEQAVPKNLMFAVVFLTFSLCVLEFSVWRTFQQNFEQPDVEIRTKESVARVVVSTNGGKVFFGKWILSGFLTNGLTNGQRVSVENRVAVTKFSHGENTSQIKDKITVRTLP